MGSAWPSPNAPHRRTRLRRRRRTACRLGWESPQQTRLPRSQMSMPLQSHHRPPSWCCPLRRRRRPPAGRWRTRSLRWPPLLEAVSCSLLFCVSGLFGMTTGGRVLNVGGRWPNGPMSMGPKAARSARGGRHELVDVPDEVGGLELVVGCAADLASVGGRPSKSPPTPTTERGFPAR